tara:strand:- start:103 stop:543 length:441 start_codon:yes stop_codon:yes gene_type:complete
MVKNIIKYIFIYTLLVGCGSNGVLETCYSNCHLDVNAPSLEIDSNNYYHMAFLSGYIQTFATLEAQTGSDNSYKKVEWLSNKEMYMGHGGWANLVNGNSYSDEDGRARSVLGVWEIFVGDTITIYAGYKDKCDIQYIDSLKVVIDG